MTISSAIDLDVVVVGAGLGGLVTAIGMRSLGHRVKLLERAKQLGEVGAGIQIPPNSTRILEKLGVAEVLQKYCMEPSTINCRTYKKSQLMVSQQLVPDVKDVYGSPYWHVHRADFHKALVEVAEREGVEIILNAEVTRMDFDKNAVVLADGSEVHGDLVIGADGLKSATRTSMSGNPNMAYNTGDLVYRLIIKTSKLRKIPELQFLTKPGLHFWFGPQMHVVIYLLQGGESCNVVIASPDVLPPDVNIAPADLPELRELFKDWDPMFQKLVDTIDSVAKWRLQNSREMDTWVHSTANFTLLGDSAHATLPYLAQGAAQAVEDAAVLTGLLSKLQSKEEIHDALLVYEKIRKPRASRVVEMSTYLGEQVYHLEDGPTQVARDKQLLERPIKSNPFVWADPYLREWLFSYDAFAEADKGWADFKAGRPIEVYDVKL